jgi:type IV secretion system protein VirB10
VKASRITGSGHSATDAHGEAIADSRATVPPVAGLPSPYPQGAQGQPVVSSGIRANLQQEKEAFLSQAGQTEPYLTKPLIPSLSRYELKAGTVIPGALITGINTDLPGQIIGQVTQNVYDTVTGKYLLIPQGTRLLGKYQSSVSNGQNRALVVWQRLILPNGKSILLDGMPGTDAAGMAGLKDAVDYHAGKLAGSVALSTALAYAGNLARNPNANAVNGTGEDIVGDTVAQEANRIGDKIIDRDLDVQPTITIRPGWTFNVLVNADIVLEPYTDTVPNTLPLDDTSAQRLSEPKETKQ